MSNSVVKLKPVVVDEIEFYSNGEIRGMSISGLAKLSSSEVFADDNEGVLVSDIPDCLKSFIGKDFYVRAFGIKNAKIIPSGTCAGLILLVFPHNLVHSLVVVQGFLSSFFQTIVLLLF